MRKLYSEPSAIFIAELLCTEAEQDSDLLAVIAIAPCPPDRNRIRPSGLPDNVKLMDLRAGGATEAEESDADFAAIKTLLTHSEKQDATTMRYVRRTRTVVQQLREASRSKAGNDE